MTGIIILAAGSSSRLGKPKQNLVFKGLTLLQISVEVAIDSICQPVIVVLGANSEVIRPTIEGKPIFIVDNENWEEGMASSIRLGITKLQRLEPNTDSVILTLCDQPFVTRAILDQLVQSKSKKGIAACGYNDTIGVPALFDEFYFNKLLLLKGREGARKLLLKHPDAITVVPFPLGGVDIDTMEDFEKLNFL